MAEFMCSNNEIAEPIGLQANVLRKEPEYANRILAECLVTPTANGVTKQMLNQVLNVVVIYWGFYVTYDVLCFNDGCISNLIGFVGNIRYGYFVCCPFGSCFTVPGLLGGLLGNFLNFPG